MSNKRYSLKEQSQLNLKMEAFEAENLEMVF